MTLARDLLQVIQDTVFSKKLDETPKRCPLVKEESDLSSDVEEATDTRIANLIDFFFTIVKSQKGGRKGSSGSCFKSEVTPEETKPLITSKANTELEAKMETLMDFLASTGCMEKETGVSDNKITLMEFLFGPEDIRPSIEVVDADAGLTESNINIKDLTYIDDTPEEEAETLVEMLIKYMEDYSTRDKFHSLSLTPSLSEKSKSDITISKLETFSDISKTKSDSTLTHTQDTVIERGEDLSTERRISETVVDLSNVKNDLETIFNEAIERVCALKRIEDDIMSEQEDIENYESYTKPPSFAYCLPYSMELSDIIEEDEPSSRDDRLTQTRQVAQDLVKYIEDRVLKHFNNDSDDEFDISLSMKRSSISLIDLRNIPDLPPSMIIKPKVIKVDKSTSTIEISDSLSDLSRRVDSACMTEDTTLSSSSERNEKAFEKIESIQKFFSRSRLGIIDEIEEQIEKIKETKQVFFSSGLCSNTSDHKAGQASLDDVEDLQDDDKTGIDKGCGDGNFEQNDGSTTEESNLLQQTFATLDKSNDKDVVDIEEDLSTDDEMVREDYDNIHILQIVANKNQIICTVSDEASKNVTESDEMGAEIDKHLTKYEEELEKKATVSNNSSSSPSDTDYILKDTFV